MLLCRTVITICCLALLKKKKKTSNNSCYWGKKSIQRTFADAQFLAGSQSDECKSAKQTARWWTRAVRWTAENQLRLMKLYWFDTLSIDLLRCSRSGLGVMSPKPAGEPRVKNELFYQRSVWIFTQLLPKKLHTLQAKKITKTADQCQWKKYKKYHQEDLKLQVSRWRNVSINWSQWCHNLFSASGFSPP